MWNGGRTGGDWVCVGGLCIICATCMCVCVYIYAWQHLCECVYNFVYIITDNRDVLCKPFSSTYNVSFSLLHQSY